MKPNKPSRNLPGFIRRPLLAVLVIALTGCTALTRTEYRRPEVNLPEQWQYLPDSGEQVVPVSRWWQVFEDPELNRLIDRVLTSNNDLAVAAIKVRKARLEAGLEGTALTPQLSVSASSGTKKDLDSGDRTDSSGTSTELSWEVDLWGKLASSRDAAEWEAKATGQDLANTALSLVGTTADLYWQTAYLNQAIATSRESIDYTRKTLALVEVKYRAGAVSELELFQAEQDMERQKADLADLNRQLAEVRNGLSVLLGQAPGEVLADPGRLSEMPIPALDAGIPAAVLGNRPDLRAAELRLRSTLADGDSTRAGYYPALSLTSSLGTGSDELVNLLSNPAAALGAGLTLPFVQWRQMKFNTRIAENEYEQAVVAFRQTLYEALQDVADALSARKYYIIQETALQRSYSLAKKAEQAAKIRYQAGKTGVQDWLDQQNIRREADLSLAQNRYNQMKNQMTLYMALGGDTDLVEDVQ